MDWMSTIILARYLWCWERNGETKEREKSSIWWLAILMLCVGIRWEWHDVDLLNHHLFNDCRNTNTSRQMLSVNWPVFAFDFSKISIFCCLHSANVFKRSRLLVCKVASYCTTLWLATFKMALLCNYCAC